MDGEGLNDVRSWDISLLVPVCTGTSRKGCWRHAQSQLNGSHGMQRCIDKRFWPTQHVCLRQQKDELVLRKN